MASLTRDSRDPGGIWICCYTAADGRQLKRSTRTRDKTKARIICRELEAVESQGRKGYLTSDEQARRLLTASLERITGRKLYDPSVREWLERWLATEQGAVAEATIRRYSQ